ncbi:RecBCD enzyme subunit RecB [Thermodesulfomicrobium sp. WS]|uniref:UvrD-helicase domain-containing protein n=1 Tax=Thermodesulfomicrobium sp. WS TaxID=3004129 RepID=UPI002492C9D0|nr:UvrD-helicase domain-containing protein [Thermodesulfomicrobium sp. WS]BDV00574.1 RecBCD enzyme subunit RecB [Thermodesulfomicrobium sp. WS]
MTDLFSLPLSGRVLVEASAGTGKTYALEVLFIRLVALEGIPVERILTVTFTDAATQELRSRLTQRLTHCLHQHTASSDDVVSRRLQEAEARGIPVAARLAAARLAMDQAPICTIHGFCQRLISRFGLSAGASVLTDDATPIIHHAAMELWRQELCTLPGLAGQYLRQTLRVEDLEALLRTPALVQNPVIHPAAAPADTHELFRTQDAFQDALQAVQTHWDAIEETVAWCETHRQTVFLGNRIRQATLANALDAWRKFLATPWKKPASQDQDALAKLLPEHLGKCLKAGADPNFSPLVHLAAAWSAAQDFYRAADLWRTQTLARAASTAMARIDAASEELGMHGFDALIRQAAALVNDPEICRQAQETWRVAIVDEFQDTDALQEHILARIFDHAGHCRITVGDPKQAIYAFRGADIHVYFAAADRCEHRATLDTNYRAAPALVAAVNAIFSRHANAFVLPQMAFSPVQPRPAPWPSIEDPDCSAACVLWRVPAPDTPLPQGTVIPLLAQAVAAEISRLLARGVRLDGAPIHPGHIAVLVDTRAQMLPIARALEAARIPCILEEDASVLDSAEAQGVLALLFAMREPRCRARVATALATDFMGFDASAIRELHDHPEELEIWQERFAEAMEVWRRQGVVAALEWLFTQVHTRERLLRLPQGLRAVTNLDHLLELLQLHESRGATPAALCRLVASPDTASNNTTKLRPIGAQEAVRILTVHKSKGLEFMIVFCPYLFRATDAGSPPLFYHDQRGLVMDLEGGADAQTRAREEALAEGVRLAYVALTRASHRLYFAWGRINQADTSGLAWVLHRIRGGRWKGFRDADVDADLASLAHTISIQVLPTTQPQPWTPPQPAWELRITPWTRALPPPPAIHSFTGLMRGLSQTRPGWDDEPPKAAAARPETPREIWDIAQFPRGPVAGSCVHAIWENIAANMPVEDAVRRGLETYGLDLRWTDALTQMVEHVLHADLGGLCLREHQGWVAEMEFLLPTQGLSRMELAAMTRSFNGRTPPFARDVGSGWITGFVDAVLEIHGRYYVVDWKTHLLGETPEAYTPAAMAKIMEEHGYDLQAALYLAALDRLLAARMPGCDPLELLGGAFFLFVRGIHPRYPGHGIVHIPAHPPTIHAMRSRLCSLPQS